MLTTLRNTLALRRAGVEISLTAHPRYGDRRLVNIAPGCRIGGGTILVAEGTRNEVMLSLGPRVIVGDYSNIRASGGPITIGAGSRLAQFVSLIGANHALDSRGWALEEHSPSSGVRIGEGCWLGVGCIVLPDVEIGDGSIVAAGAVVTKSCAPGSRLAGVPAQSISR